MDKKNLITIVCFANYCRSPCAEFILKEKYMNRFNVTSAGIEPIVKTDMDPRTKVFLNSLGVNVGLHSPKKINKKIFNDSKYVFGLDYEIVGYLNNLFPNSKQKIKLLSYQQPHTYLPDPYHMDENNYAEVMNSIKEVCDNLRF